LSILTLKLVAKYLLYGENLVKIGPMDPEILVSKESLKIKKRAEHIAYIHRESKKRRQYTLFHIFAK